MTTESSLASEIRRQLSLFEHNASMLQDGEAVRNFFGLVNRVANGKAILHEILVNQYQLDVAATQSPQSVSPLDTDYLVYYDQDVTASESEAVSQCANSNGITGEQALVAHHFRLWVEAVLQSLVSVVGIVCNSVALFVLIRATRKSSQSSSQSSRRLQSVFNSMLAFLLLLHTLYIATTVTLVLRSWFPSYLLDFLFVHLLYPLKPMLLHAATFLTVVMARERYKAIRHPLEYRKTTAGASPWCLSLRYVLPSVLAAAICVSPLYFEVAQEAKVSQRVMQQDGEVVVTNVTSYELRVTQFRLNSHYMMWYKNLGTFVATILLPLLCLAFWNWNTYAVILRRQRMKNRPNRSHSLVASGCCGGAASPDENNDDAVANAVKTKAGIAKEEEARKARILFVIVVLFLACNLLRLVLNVEETLSMRAYQQAAEEGCNSVPLWAILVNIVSQLLLTLNATSGVFVYCVMSRDFRTELMDMLGVCGNKARRTQSRARAMSVSRMEEKRLQNELSGNLSHARNGTGADKLSESKPSLGSANSVVTTTVALPTHTWHITTNEIIRPTSLRSDNELDAIDHLDNQGEADNNQEILVENHSF